MVRLKLSLTTVIAAVAFFLVSVVHAKDEQMLALANASGCFICHKIAPEANPDDLPLAPSYQEIALRYRGENDVFSPLLDRVLHGTVYRDQAWSGKVGMWFMPPNVNVTREDASSLLHWILKLDIDPEVAERLMYHDRMLALSTVSGCTICHRVDPVKEMRVIPLAPSFKEVAAHYRDRPDSKDRLLESVLEGTQGNQKVWQNVNMQFMPPNVALKKDEAAELVNWILSLDTKGVAIPMEPPKGVRSSSQ
ncbi:MAG: c-type cytochrome [Candidatus Thiodiazotropha sp.]